MTLTRRAALAAPAVLLPLAASRALAGGSDAPTALDAILAELLEIEAELNRRLPLALAATGPAGIALEAKLLSPLDRRHHELLRQAADTPAEHPRDVATLIRLSGTTMCSGHALTPGASIFDVLSQDFNDWSDDLDGRLFRAMFRAAEAMAAG